MSYLPPIRDSDVVDGLSVRCLKIFGIWRIINDYRTTRKRNAIMKFEVVTTLIGAVLYLCCQSLSFFMIKVDIQKTTFIVMHSMSALQISCKMLVFWFRLDELSTLFDLIRKDFLTSLPEHKREEAKEIYKRISKKCNLLCMAAFLVNISIMILFIASPGISVDYIAHHTGSMVAVTGGKQKILGGWYPVPMSESPYYEVIMVYEVIMMLWGALLLAVYVCVFYIVLMGLYAQYAVLGHHISTLKVSTASHFDRDSSSEKKESLLYDELYRIIKDHKKLLRYSDELRKVYNPLVTMILGMGILVLIIAVFQFLFGGRGSPMFTFRSFQYVLYQGVEVFMFCFGSSSVEEASSDLQFAIYSSDWYRADTKFKKAAQMLMVRARKGVTLTAIRMYPVNVETIMSILQFTYSVATLMSRMAE